MAGIFLIQRKKINQSINQPTMYLTLYNNKSVVLELREGYSYIYIKLKLVEVSFSTFHQLMKTHTSNYWYNLYINKYAGTTLMLELNKVQEGTNIPPLEEHVLVIVLRKRRLNVVLNKLVFYSFKNMTHQLSTLKALKGVNYNL